MGRHKSRESQRIEVTLQLDQTIVADVHAMIEEYNQTCQCGHTHVLDEVIEINLADMLTAYHMAKIANKYNV